MNDLDAEQAMSFLSLYHDDTPDSLDDRELVWALELVGKAKEAFNEAIEDEDSRRLFIPPVLSSDPQEINDPFEVLLKCLSYYLDGDYCEQDPDDHEFLIALAVLAVFEARLPIEIAAREQIED